MDLTRLRVGARCLLVACACACACISGCAPAVYEPLLPTVEDISTVVQEGDHVRIHTLSGDVIEDTVVRLTGNELECRSRTVAIADIKRIQRAPGDPWARAGGISFGGAIAEPVGLALRVHAGGRRALAGAVGRTIWLENWFHFHFDIQHHRRGFDPEDTEGLLPHYFGIGVGSSQQLDGIVTIELRFPVGWEWFGVGESWFGTFAEIVPVLRLDPYENPNDPALQLRAAAGVWFSP
jgi:hypothetical protein